LIRSDFIIGNFYNNFNLDYKLFPGVYSGKDACGAAMAHFIGFPPEADQVSGVRELRC